jgi:hypothetical protein
MRTLPAIFVLSLVILLIACGKDKFETKPKLEIKDYNTKELFQGQDLRIRINYFDKEGDLNNAPIIGIRERLNVFPVFLDLADTFRVLLPDFPAKDNGEISFQLPYGDLFEGSVEDDTIRFRFAVTDVAGNKSDTITSDVLVIRKQ